MRKNAGVLILLMVTSFGGCPVEADQVMLSEITTSCILDSKVTYYVPNPPLLIHSIDSNGIDVAIPSDTLIIIAQRSGDYPAVLVYDNANIQTGSPAPEPNALNEISVFGDTNNPSKPVWIVGESGDPFSNNKYGIVIDRSAGKRSQLNNIYLSGFNYAIVADQQLDYSLSSIYIYDCNYGILSFGENNIVNSVVNYFGINGTAYCFIPYSWDGYTTFEGVNFNISNCLANDGGYSYEVYGLPTELTMPNFYSTNCAATNCYSAFNGWDGYISFSIICPGLYNNTNNKNFPEMPFDYPVYETSNPLVIDSNDYRFFLNPNSQFVDNGSGLSQVPGWTTRIDGAPDVNVEDIWPHYQTKNHEPSADLNSDHVVDINDLSVLAAQWLQNTFITKADLDGSKSIGFGDLLILAENWLWSGQPGSNQADIVTDGKVNFRDFSFLAGYWHEDVTEPLSSDLNGDNIVNFLDYSIFANQWQTNKIYIETVNLAMLSTADPNNLSGDVGICLKNIPSYTETVSAYLDNVLIGSLMFGWNIEQDWIGMDTDKFLNGWHTIRLVSTDYSGNMINHEPIKVRFNNLLCKVSIDEHFNPTDGYRFSGFYERGGTIQASVKNIFGSQIWSNTYTGQHINIIVPGSVLTNENICSITISEVGSDGMATM